MELLDAIRETCKTLDEKFARDIVVLDISEISVIADYFIILGGTNPTQIQTLAATAEEALTRRGIALRHNEGMREASWVLLDFGDIIVHIFDRESRAFYHLERVWGDAKLVEL